MPNRLVVVETAPKTTEWIAFVSFIQRKGCSSTPENASNKHTAPLSIHYFICSMFYYEIAYFITVSAINANRGDQSSTPPHVSFHHTYLYRVYVLLKCKKKCKFCLRVFNCLNLSTRFVLLLEEFRRLLGSFLTLHQSAGTTTFKRKI